MFLLLMDRPLSFIDFSNNSRELRTVHTSFPCILILLILCLIKTFNCHLDDNTLSITVPWLVLAGVLELGAITKWSQCEAVTQLFTSCR